MLGRPMATALPFAAQEIAALRADTPGCLARAHFNNAGAGLMPGPVLRAIQEHLELEAQVGGYEAAALRAERIEETYAVIAALLGTAPRNLALVENATVAFSQALSAIPFAPGDVLLTTRNDYVSNQLMFLSLAGRLGIEVVRAPDAPAGGVDVGALEELVRRRRPRLVAVTHVPTNSGLVQPVGEVGRVCSEHDVPYLVDACQSAGQLPLAVADLHCDFLSATCRKFLRGPRGAGFLFVSDAALERGDTPLFVDMRGAAWRAADAYEPEPSARRFENWEFAYALVLGAGAAASYALAVGVERIAARSIGLAAELRRRLADLPRVRVLDRGPELCAIVTLHVEGGDPQELHAALERRGFNTSLSLRGYAMLDFDAKGVGWALRLSPHCYNTADEVERLVAALGEIAAAPAG
jgi:selenocysteine lyase/cysteine desulfurase